MKILCGIGVCFFVLVIFFDDVWEMMVGIGGEKVFFRNEKVFLD